MRCGPAGVSVTALDAYPGRTAPWSRHPPSPLPSPLRSNARVVCTDRKSRQSPVQCSFRSRRVPLLVVCPSLALVFLLSFLCPRKRFESVTDRIIRHEREDKKGQGGGRPCQGCGLRVGEREHPELFEKFATNSASRAPVRASNIFFRLCSSAYKKLAKSVKAKRVVA